MTQVFNEDGKVIPATVVSAGPISAVQLKTKEKDGYEAVDFRFLLKKRKKKMFTKPSANWEILPTLRNTGLEDGETKAELGSVFGCFCF